MAHGEKQMIANAQAPIGVLIRTWREHRRLSQLALAMDAEISARHLSFIETSRSTPSREMVLKLSERLEVPLRERNRLLVAAGFAPVFTQASLDAPTMSPVREVLQAVLQGPFPALIVDRRWNIIDANAAAAVFMREVDPKLRGDAANAMRIALHPRGMAPIIVNFGQWRAHLLDRLRREAEFSRDAFLADLLEEVLAYPGADWESADTSTELVVPLRLRLNGREFAFLSTVATFGTPVDVTVAELMLETFYPVDEATRRRVASLDDAALRSG
jgi:transcriptional regulator with XRE-family HTH domain